MHPFGIPIQKVHHGRDLFQKGIQRPYNGFGVFDNEMIVDVFGNFQQEALGIFTIGRATATARLIVAATNRKQADFSWKTAKIAQQRSQWYGQM
jgi:hypothetical protein